MEVCAEETLLTRGTIGCALAAQQQHQYCALPLTAVPPTVSADTAAEVDAFGDEQWERAVRMGLPGRSGAECAAQWATRLRPGTYSGDWTAEEDARLTQLANRHKRANVRARPPARVGCSGTVVACLLAV